MNILSHFQEYNQNNFIFSSMTSLYADMLSPFFTSSSTFNYTNIIESLGKGIYSLAQDSLKSWLEDMDFSFRFSTQRKERYYVKNTRPRTIITPFGEVTYTRTIYSFKDGSDGLYTHVDEILGIPKYDRYDPCVKSMMISLYANHNSMIKVGKILGEHIFSPFSLDEKRFLHTIPRQTIQSTIKNHPQIVFSLKKREITPESLYIMADEKWIPLQSHDKEGNKQKQMVKAAVIFEDIRNASTNVESKKPRHELINKHIILNSESDFWGTTYERINELYDLEKVKNIHILGDGASWIKAGKDIMSTQNTKADFSLDKFHLHQSLTRIEKDKEIRNKLFEYIVLDNDKKLFRKLIEVLISESPHREESIRKEEQYISNNWTAIQSAHFNISMGCSMESAISHYLASAFTSVPKGYGKSNLSKYVSNREHQVNNVNLSKLYIQSLDYEKENDKIIIKDSLDFSIFEHNTQRQGKASTSNYIKGFMARH